MYHFLPFSSLIFFIECFEKKRMNGLNVYNFFRTFEFTGYLLFLIEFFVFSLNR